MEQNHNREQSEKGSDNNLRLGLGAVAAIYILYLGVKLLKSFADGTGGAPAWVDIVFGFLFIACGAGYMIWEVSHRIGTLEAISDIRYVGGR